MLELAVFVGSILGIALLVALNAWLGLSRPAVIDSLDRVVEQVDIDSVGFEAGRGVVADDGRAALLEDCAADRIALVLARADRFVIRYLGPGALRSVDASDGALHIGLRDFSLPAVAIRIQDEAAAQDWRARLEQFKA